MGGAAGFPAGVSVPAISRSDLESEFCADADSASSRRVTMIGIVLNMGFIVIS